MRYLFILALAVTACGEIPDTVDSGVRNPFGAGNAVGGSESFSFRHGQVRTYVSENRQQLLTEIAAGSGDVLTGALDVAQIPATERADRIAELQVGLDNWREDTAQLVNILVIYGRG